MVAIVAPALLPCPQSSSVSPEERRLLSEGYPRTLRTIETDERQYQTLTWMLDANRSAVFSTWWKTDLVYGAAWWSAPPTWPTPEGLVVKIRRFAADPLWEYLSSGYWRVSCPCEVAGAMLPPQMTPELPVAWSDSFDGAGGTPLFSHTQSNAYGGSVWSEFVPHDEPVLLGMGSAGTSAASINKTGALTEWSGDPIPLISGWFFDLDFTVKPLQESPFGELPWSRLQLFGQDTSNVLYVFKPAISGTAVLNIAISESGTDVNYSVPQGVPLKIRTTFFDDGYQLVINGLVQPKVTAGAFPPFQPVSMRWQIGSDYNHEDNIARAGGTGTVQRLAFRGVLDA
jgi:hypothetical protein